MTANNKKKTVIVILLLAVCMAGVGYYMYNKGPVDVKDSPAVKIEAGTLYNAYLTDSSAAQKNYSGKILQVSGLVSKVSDNQQGEMIVLLKTNTNGAFVNCTLQQKINNIKPNDKLQVKGICSGMGQGEQELGIMGDLYLTRSLIVE